MWEMKILSKQAECLHTQCRKSKGKSVMRERGKSLTAGKEKTTDNTGEQLFALCIFFFFFFMHSFQISVFLLTLCLGFSPLQHVVVLWKSFCRKMV